MRAITKTIEFDFHFDYPVAGKYESSNCITVCEPGFDNRNVFTRMGSFISTSHKGLLKMFAGQSRDEIEESVETKEPEAAKEEGPEPDALSTMRLGLTGDEYEQFMKYVERALTGNKLLAYVGTDPEKRVAITEEVWRNIANQGGLAEMERVHGAFTSFFTNTQPAQAGSAKTNGTAPPSGQPSTRKAASSTKVH